MHADLRIKAVQPVTTSNANQPSVCPWVVLWMTFCGAISFTNSCSADVWGVLNPRLAELRATSTGLKAELESRGWRVKLAGG